MYHSKLVPGPGSIAAQVLRQRSSGEDLRRFSAAPRAVALIADVGHKVRFRRGNQTGLFRFFKYFDIRFIHHFLARLPVRRRRRCCAGFLSLLVAVVVASVVVFDGFRAFKVPPIPACK